VPILDQDDLGFLGVAHARGRWTVPARLSHQHDAESGAARAIQQRDKGKIVFRSRGSRLERSLRTRVKRGKWFTSGIVLVGIRAVLCPFIDESHHPP